MAGVEYTEPTAEDVINFAQRQRQRQQRRQQIQQKQEKALEGFREGAQKREKLSRTLLTYIPGPLSAAGYISQILAGDRKKEEVLEDVSGEVLALFGGKTAPIMRQVFAGKRAATAATVPKEKWFRGLDARQRFEISDVDAKLDDDLWEFLEKQPPGKGVREPLYRILKHPELYKAYPELKHLTVLVGKGPVDGVMDMEANELRTTALDAKQLRSNILHEIQHWIQSKEEFARGTNVATMREFLSDPVGFERRSGIEIQLVHRNLPTQQDLNKFVYDTTPGISKIPSSRYPTVEYLMYLHNAGEAEARLVQRRAEMTAQELLANPVQNTLQWWQRNLDINPQRIHTLFPPPDMLL